MVRYPFGRWRVAFAVVIVGVVLVIVAPVFAPPAEEQKQRVPQRSVLASELGGTVPVIGKLGQPLGKLVTIEGRCAKGAVLRKKGLESATIVFVETIDGKAAQERCWVEIWPYGPSREQSAKPGTPCKLLGYETGGFRGSPDGAMEASGETFADHRWCFITHFEYVKVLGHEQDDSKKPYSAPGEGP